MSLHVWGWTLQFTRTQFFDPYALVQSQNELWYVEYQKLIPTTWGQLQCCMEVSELCLQLWMWCNVSSQCKQTVFYNYSAIMLILGKTFRIINSVNFIFVSFHFQLDHTMILNLSFVHSYHINYRSVPRVFSPVIFCHHLWLVYCYCIYALTMITHDSCN